MKRVFEYQESLKSSEKWNQTREKARIIFYIVIFVLFLYCIFKIYL